MSRVRFCGSSRRPNDIGGTGADMIVLSIGRVIALPGVPYDPSICDINRSHRLPIAIRSMDLCSGPKLCFIRRAGCARLGTKVQKVRNLIVIRGVNGRADHVGDFGDSELKGSWDVAVPRVNRRRRGKSVAMMKGDVRTDRHVREEGGGGTGPDLSRVFPP